VTQERKRKGGADIRGTKEGKEKEGGGAGHGSCHWGKKVSTHTQKFPFCVKEGKGPIENSEPEGKGKKGKTVEAGGP